MRQKKRFIFSLSNLIIQNPKNLEWIYVGSFHFIAQFWLLFFVLQF